jgi:thioredoxin reductase (NADPH)
VFIYVGFHPNTELFQGQVELDEAGHIAADIMMATSAPGVFAAGDVRCHSYRQMGTAIGDGITAALSAYHYLSEAGTSKAGPAARTGTPGVS